MKKKEKKYTTCGDCPAESREICLFYEPNTDDNLCVYDFLRARREEKEKENKNDCIFNKI